MLFVTLIYGALMGFSAAIALIHLRTAAAGRSRSVHLSFAAYCIAAALLALAVLLGYQAESVAESLFAARSYFAVFMLQAVALVWFVTFFTKVKSRRFPIGYSLIMISLVVLSIAFPQSTEGLEIERLSLPSGELVSRMPPLTSIEVFSLLTGPPFWIYVFWAAYRQYRSGERLSALALAAATLLGTLLIYFDLVVDLMELEFVYLSNLASFFYVAIMAARLAGERVEAEDELNRTVDALAKIEERYANAIAGSSDGIWDWNIRTGDFFASQRFRELLELDPGETLESLDKYTERLHPEDREASGSAMMAHLEKKAPFDVEHRLLLGNNQYRWFRSRGQALWDHRDLAYRMAGSIQDIDSRVRAHSEREQLLQELAAAHAELQSFTYAVSHDLKSPLVTIESYAGYVGKDLAKSDFKRATQDLERLTNAAHHMRDLLEDLLELSRVGRLDSPMEPIDMTATAKRAAALLAGSVDEWRGSIEIEDLAPAHGNPKRALQLLQNLLENALRYSDPDRPGKVHVTSETVDGEVIYSVADNGIGVPAEDQERIFGPFEQVHGGGEGSGFGLAIARRIAQVHNGRIWVESDDRNRGATFRFSLGG